MTSDTGYAGTSAGSPFEQIWLPRIGPTAAARLRTNGYQSLVAGPLMLALAVACSFSLGRSTPLLGVGAVAGMVVVMAWWLHGAIRLATALSAFFGTTIRWWEMARFRPARFDHWRAARGLDPVPAPPGTGPRV